MVTNISAWDSHRMVEPVKGIAQISVDSLQGRFSSSDLARPVPLVLRPSGIGELFQNCFFDHVFPVALKLPDFGVRRRRLTRA
jgi:hypothetical protein